MTRPLRLPLLAAAASTLCACGSREGPADRGDARTYPRKPIKVIVPFPAGGGSDTFTRIMQKAIRDAELLPQPMVVINVPGAGATIGSRRVRDAPPDGYTILNLHEGILSSKYAGRVPYGPEAFRPIAATGESAPVICVKEDSPHGDLAGLVAAAAEQPDSVLFGMAPGTPSHFAGRRLELANGKAQFRFVASGGGSKRFNDLIGGHIDATIFSLAEYIKFAPGGVRAVGYLGTERHPELPDLPTGREQGLDVVMSHVQYWWAPKSTPGEAIDRIADALQAAMQTDYVRGKLAELKTEPLFLRGEALEEHLRERELDFQGAALVEYEGLPDPVLPVAIVAVLLAIASALESLRRRGRSPEAREGGAAWRYLAIAFATLATYVLAMQWMNLTYAAATAVFVPVMAVAGGLRSPRSIALMAAVGVVLGLGCFYVFTEVLIIDLP